MLADAVSGTPYYKATIQAGKNLYVIIVSAIDDSRLMSWFLGSRVDSFKCALTKVVKIAQSPHQSRIPGIKSRDQR